MKEWFLKMWYGVCGLIDSIIYLLTLSFITTSFGLDAARNIARYRYKKGSK